MHWRTVGIILLNDQRSAKVDAIHDQYHGNAQNITLEILKKWINGEGIKDRSWRKLLFVLRHSCCEALAEEMEHVFLAQLPPKPFPGKSNNMSLQLSGLLLNNIMTLPYYVCRSKSASFCKI